MADGDLDYFYKHVYGPVFNGGAVGRVSNLVHRSMEAPYSHEHFFEKVLELGAGQGQHRRFVRHGFSQYIESDLRLEPLLQSDHDPRVERQVIDANVLTSVKESSVDRIIATCLLTHLANPEAALREWREALVPNGVLSLYLPADPGLVLRLAQKFTTARKTRKRGLDYWSIHYREHRYHFSFLELIVREVFGDANVWLRSWPLPAMSWNFSLWFTAELVKR